MASIFERLNNREAFPVDIKGGTLFVREPLLAEVRRFLSLEGEQRLGLMFALCLVDKDGSREFTPAENETDETFAQRAWGECEKHFGASACRTLQAAITKLTQPPDVDSLVKN